MRKNILNKLLVLSCLVIGFGCKAKKQLVSTPSPVAPQPVATVKLADQMEAIKATQLNFNTFSGKANAKLDIDGEKNDVVLNIRINHDKEIWVSVSVTVLVTVEVARAIITPDSIQTMDKLHGLYLKKPFSYIYQYASKQINYKMLESLLVGNALPEILRDKNASLQTDNGKTTLSGSLDDLVYALMLNPDMKAGQLNLSNHNAGQSLLVTNNEFISAGSKTMPSQIDIQSAVQNKKNQITLHYTKVDLDQPLQYPFNIPESYKPADEN